VASGLSITTLSVIEGARVWSSTTSVSPHDMSHVASMVRVWLLHQRQHQARTADSCSRAPSRSSSPRPEPGTESPPAKCAGARRYTVNHHLPGEGNLEARSSERDDLTDEGTPRQPSTPSLSWTAFSFINEFNAWKNGSLMTRCQRRRDPGLSWRHELPGESSSARAWTGPGLENFSASRRGERSGTPAGFPRFQAKGKVAPRFGCATARRRAEHHRASPFASAILHISAYPSSAR